MENFLLKTDSYKLSHNRQYPLGTECISSYIEARKGGEALFFGLQAYLETLKPITFEDVFEADAFLKPHGVPFNRDGWLRLVHKHAGNLPVIISALPEGMIVPQGTPMVQLFNTDFEFPWLTSYLETSLLRAIWYPTTVATLSWRIKNRIRAALEVSADDPEAELPFKLHDFGARGASSSESAALGGMAHLINFGGSDTIEALWAAKQFYGEPMAGFSIPAAEHSTITSWGKDGELDAYRNMLTAFPESKLVAVVSDSYDIFHACRDIWGGVLKGKVEKLGESGRTLVIRPDSGDPVTTLQQVFAILFDRFDWTTNSRGYKVLPSYVRVIQGDGVNEASIGEILDDLLAHGISATNVAFGMGGALLQKVDRDTLSFAMKASFAIVNGRGRDVWKEPLGDASKASKRGRLGVYREDGRIVTLRQDNARVNENLLQPVWTEGTFRRRTTFAEIRRQAACAAICGNTTHVRSHTCQKSMSQAL